MDLLVISDVLLCKHALYLLEVPIWNARHLLHFLGCSPHVLVRALGSIDAEPKPIVITFTTYRGVRQLLTALASLVEAVACGLAVLA